MKIQIFLFSITGQYSENAGASAIVNHIWKGVG